jgi:hypothetical protein
LYGGVGEAEGAGEAEGGEGGDVEAEGDGAAGDAPAAWIGRPPVCAGSGPEVATNAAAATSAGSRRERRNTKTSIRFCRESRD